MSYRSELDTARERAERLEDELAALPRPPAKGGWGIALGIYVPSMIVALALIAIKPEDPRTNDHTVETSRTVGQQFTVVGDTLVTTVRTGHLITYPSGGRSEVYVAFRGHSLSGFTKKWETQGFLVPPRESVLLTTFHDSTVVTIGSKILAIDGAKGLVTSNRSVDEPTIHIRCVGPTFLNIRGHERELTVAVKDGALISPFNAECSEPVLDAFHETARMSGRVIFKQPTFLAHVGEARDTAIPGQRFAPKMGRR